MFFTRRNAQDLTELKALTHGLHDHVLEALERLGRIDEVRLQRLAAPDRRDTLVGFVHIPKTAGATATTMLARAYSAHALHGAGNFVRAPETTEKKLTRRPGGWEDWQGNGGRVSVGHVPYRVFRRHLPPATRYITFLREPVDRVLSHYYRHIHRPDLNSVSRDQRRERGREVAGSLEEALVEQRLPQIRNLATRFLCGHPTHRGELAPSALDNAKANLRSFAFVGIQERFDESIVLLQRTLGIELVPYLTRHVSDERPRVDEIPDEQRALIAEHNQLDAELYRFGKRLYEEAVAAAGQDFAAEVEELRASSMDANDEAVRNARAWLDRELPPGTTRAAAPLRVEARAAGVRVMALKQVFRELGVKAQQDRDGEKTVTRPGSGATASLPS